MGSPFPAQPEFRPIRLIGGVMPIAAPIRSAEHASLRWQTAGRRGGAMKTRRVRLGVAAYTRLSSVQMNASTGFFSHSPPPTGSK